MSECEHCRGTGLEMQCIHGITPEHCMICAKELKTPISVGTGMTPEIVEVILHQDMHQAVRIARLERLLLLFVKAELGHGGMRTEILQAIEKELERG